MKITTVIVEIRQKLQACQFYVHTEGTLTEPDVKIQDNSLIIFDESEELAVELPEYLCKVPDSVTCFSRHDNILTFRIRIEPETMYGSSKTEVIHFKDKKIEPENFNFAVPKNTDLTMFCKFCKKAIECNGVVFNRVLPLPSSGMEEGDYFCHKQDNRQLQCLPRENDCLYGTGYFCIRPDIFSLPIPKNLQCASCKAYIGCNKGSYIVLWNSSVQFISELDQKEIEDSTLQDFFTIINQSFQLETVINPKIILHNIYTSENLIVWIIEKELHLLKIDGRTGLSTQTVVRKILYKLDDSGNSKQYVNDPNALVTETSPHVIETSLAYLAQQQQMLPLQFRKTNDFNISFIERKQI